MNTIIALRSHLIEIERDLIAIYITEKGRHLFDTLKLPIRRKIDFIHKNSFKTAYNYEYHYCTNTAN